MTNMLSEDFQETLRRAQTIAAKLRHEYTTLEHLLLALTEDKYAQLVFKACNVKLSQMSVELKKFLNKHHESIRIKDGDFSEPKFSRGIERVLIHSENDVATHQLGHVTGANVLLAMFSERDSYAVYYLQYHGMTRYQTINYLAHGTIADHDHDEEVQSDNFPEEISPTKTDVKSTPKVLETYCTDITKLAKQGKIDPLIGRSKEIERLLQILCRRNKNNPLLVGDPGVGKTAIAEGLAHRIILEEVPDLLIGVKLFSLDMGSMLAGTRYRGDFEERFKSVVSALENLDNAIVFIDEIHTVIGAGASSGSSLDASNMLKPSLARGQLRCIGATTYKEFRHHFEKDHALLRRFQKIDVYEPNVEESIAILTGVKKYYEKHHGVTYSGQAIESAARLSKRYMHTAQLPDKALDVIDEAGAAQRLMPTSKRRNKIGAKDIERTIARMAHIPSQYVGRDDVRMLKNLERNLKSVLFGQDPAITALVDAIKLARAGLRSEDKPVGCFLFSGPTGVGKTEASRQLAAMMSMNLARFDMSEYMERHSVSRLVGAPPGYVGHDQGGLLTDAVDQNPHTVLLLDEIEKAHPDIFNILLQIMDYGRLTDSNGKSVDYRHAIIIMTSNAGEQAMSKKPVGFARLERSHEDRLEIQRLFTPEFRNRLDQIIRFSHLTREHVRHIVDKELLALEDMLKPKHIRLSVGKRARDWLVEKGYSKSNGARPLSRIIDTQLKQKLAEHILFKSVKKAKHIVIRLKGSGRNAALVLDDSPPSKTSSQPKKNPKPEGQKVLEVS